MQYVNEDALIGLEPVTDPPRPLSFFRQQFIYRFKVFGTLCLFAVGCGLFFINPFDVLDLVLSSNQSNAINSLIGQDYRSSLQYSAALVCILGSIGLLYAITRNFLSRPVCWCTHCPKCHSSQLVRQPRSILQRIYGWVLALPLFHYACEECAWHGSRVDHGLLS